MYIEECSRKKKETWRRSSWRQEFNSGTCAWMCALFLVRKALPMQSRLGHTCTFRKVSSLCNMHRTRPRQLLGKLSKWSCQRPLSACVRVLQRIAWACQGREVHLQACCAQCSVCFHAHAEAFLRQVARIPKAPWAGGIHSGLLLAYIHFARRQMWCAGRIQEATWNLSAGVCG